MGYASTIAKKAGAATMALAVTAAMCPALALASAECGQQAEAPAKMTTMAKKKSAKNLKQRGVKFDLKKGKWKKFKRAVFDSKSTIAYKGRIANIKTLKAKKAGYKQTRYTIEFKLTKNPTKAQYRKDAIGLGGYAPSYQRAFEVYKKVGGTTDAYFWHIDYSTGDNLEYSNNSENVKVKIKWIKDEWTKYKSFSFKWWGSTKWYWNYMKHEKATVTVTYPSSYKNLSIGFGAPLKRDWAKNDHDYAFQNGTSGIWYMTSGFKRDIKNYHFMRIK